MRLHKSDPIKTWANGVQLAALLAEAQGVIAMRMLGLAGFWSMSSQENQRMVSEKIYALSQAARDATTVTLTGAGPEAALAAAIKPLRRRTRANVRRLAKRGPRKVR